MTAVVMLAAAIVGALFCVTVAGIKNRDLAAWFLLGLAVPAIAMIAVCIVPALDELGQRTR